MRAALAAFICSANVHSMPAAHLSWIAASLTCDKAQISGHRQLNPRLDGGHLQRPRLATSSPSRRLHELARNVASLVPDIQPANGSHPGKLNLHSS